MPTPWAVRCWDCGQGEDCALVFLTRREYARQLGLPDACWFCPRCGRDAAFDDDNHEAMTPPEPPPGAGS